MSVSILSSLVLFWRIKSQIQSSFASLPGELSLCYVLLVSQKFLWIRAVLFSESETLTSFSFHTVSLSTVIFADVQVLSCCLFWLLLCAGVPLKPFKKPFVEKKRGVREMRILLWCMAVFFKGLENGAWPTGRRGSPAYWLLWRVSLILKNHPFLIKIPFKLVSFCLYSRKLTKLFSISLCLTWSIL